MAIKYYLDQTGLGNFLNYINNNFNNEVIIGKPANTIIIANAGVFSIKDKTPVSIDLDSYITKNTINDTTQFIITNVADNSISTYTYCDKIANRKELNNIHPQVGDMYKIENIGIYAAWTGAYWEEFGTIKDVDDLILQKYIKSITYKALNQILNDGSKIEVSDQSSIVSLLENDESEVKLILTENINNMTTISIPEGKKLVLDLGGNNIISSGMAFNVAGGEIVINNGSISSNSSDAITVSNGGSVTINSANITSVSRNAISARGGNIIVNSGNIQSQEAGLLGLKDSTITINGGVITGLDNGPVMGNGSAAGTANDGTNCNIVMNGGTLRAHIQSAGYIACGVYVPNSGSFTMNGGEIISDGCGICMRGGTVNIGENAKITALGATGVKGKVGDSRVVVGPYAIVYDADSKYPAVDSLELNIANGAQLSGTDGDIDVLLAEGYTANINDNRL